LRGRLLILNLVLLALIGVVVARLRSNWLEARAREQAFLRLRLPALPAPQIVIPPPPAPIKAASYLDIATNLLLSRDRNPNVFVEPAKAKPMPALPRFYGVMDFGEGPSVILSETGKPNTQRSFRLGQQVGEFKLVSVENSGLTFDWDGTTIKSSFAELRDKNPPSDSAPATTQTPTASKTISGPTPAATTVTQIAPPAQSGRPGADFGGGFRACDPGDTAPGGTVSGGFRKVVVSTPFGSSCRWEPVK
jgi:hypothetical protein